MTTTPTHAALPTARAVRDLLEEQVGRDVTLEGGAPLAPGRPTLAYGVYVAGRLQLSGLLVMDLSLAAYVGAATTLMPRGSATEAMDRGRLTPQLERGWSEVLAASTALFGAVDLYDAYAPGAPPPTDVTTLAAAWGRRLDLTVRVGGYGTGRLAVVVA